MISDELFITSIKKNSLSRQLSLNLRIINYGRKSSFSKR